MENDYLIEIPDVQVINSDYCISKQQFLVSFDYRWVELFEDRKITTCCIIELPSKKIYAGATIKNHHDMSDDWIARRWAYKRAVLMLYMIWNNQKKTNIPFTPFWQLFRQAFAKNEIYLKERKEK